ncbi:MAG: hypothetical protein NVSMB59_05470 [Vulcanimicrobiaceae bacterium]
MRVGTDDRIGIRDARGIRIHTGAARTEDDAAQKFDIHLMDDARIRRHGSEIIERFLTPFEKRIAFFIALEFERRIFRERPGRCEAVDLHRVIDHEFDRLQRIDGFGIAAHIGHRIAHRGEIDDARYAGKILQEHPGRAIRDLVFAARRGIPTGELDDVVFRDATPVFESDEIL